MNVITNVKEIICIIDGCEVSYPVEYGVDIFNDIILYINAEDKIEHILRMDGCEKIELLLKQTTFIKSKESKKWNIAK